MELEDALPRPRSVWNTLIRLSESARAAHRIASMKLINDPLFHFERATNRVYDRAHGNTELFV